MTQDLAGRTILFLAPPSKADTWGYALYLSAMATACRRRGGRVVFHVSSPSAEYLRSEGYETVAFDGIVPRPSNRPVNSFYEACSVLGIADRALLDWLLD